MLAVALAAGILAQRVARQLRLPGIVLLLAAGVAMGPDGLGWVDPHALGEGLFGLIDFGVAVILFEGGRVPRRLWRRALGPDAAAGANRPGRRRDWRDAERFRMSRAPKRLIAQTAERVGSI